MFKRYTRLTGKTCYSMESYMAWTVHVVQQPVSPIFKLIHPTYLKRLLSHLSVQDKHLVTNKSLENKTTVKLRQCVLLIYSY